MYPHDCKRLEAKRLLRLRGLLPDRLPGCRQIVNRIRHEPGDERPARHVAGCRRNFRARHPEPSVLDVAGPGHPGRQAACLNEVGLMSAHRLHAGIECGDMGRSVEIGPDIGGAPRGAGRRARAER